jgi:hypothetical protein
MLWEAVKVDGLRELVRGNKKMLNPRNIKGF